MISAPTRAEPSLLDKIIGIDQSPIGRTPRSTPATYTGLYGHVRKLFAQTNLARLRGYGAGRFSFNTAGGRCETCKGDGFEKVEMQFLSEVVIRCPDCRGKRFKPEVLDVRYRGRNIHDILTMTVDQALEQIDQLQPKQAYFTHIAHDIRQMLMVITGRCGLLLERGPGPELRRHLLAMEMAAGDAGAMLGRLPGMSGRPPAGEPAGLAAAAEAACGMILPPDGQPWGSSAGAGNTSDWVLAQEVPAGLWTSVPPQILREAYYFRDAERFQKAAAAFLPIADRAASERRSRLLGIKLRTLAAEHLEVRVGQLPPALVTLHDAREHHLVAAAELPQDVALVEPHAEQDAGAVAQAHGLDGAPAPGPPRLSL